jgi:hypothetical protein
MTQRFNTLGIPDSAVGEGAPVLADISTCKVWIKENKEFHNFVDKMIAKTNTSLVVGTTSWKQQFIEAVTVQGGGGVSVVCPL